MAGFKPVGRMETPTGPTGILDSSRKGVKPGGKRTLGGSKGLSSRTSGKLMRKR